jgi:GT2 family glycosyltransferase
MVKVSIVIPVYNRKNFLTVCIKSLLAQSFEDFEICLSDERNYGWKFDLCRSEIAITIK